MHPTNGKAAGVSAPAALVTATAASLAQPSTIELSATAIENVLVKGDLSKLNATERVSYYRAVCNSLGLNPLTQPFAYLVLNGKMVLYAKRECTEQLRQLRGVSTRIVAREMLDDCYVVTARATDRSGREDESTGVVAIAGLKGDQKANALMRAETKAKRRVTLSLCGLSCLDESELDTVQGARTVQPEPAAADETIDIQLQAPTPQVRSWPPAEKAWFNRGQMRTAFDALREAVGEVEFAREMERAGVKAPIFFRYSEDARKSYARLVGVARRQEMQ